MSDKEIFPIVRDGYKDEIDIDWEVRNTSNKVQVDIVNRSGRVVATRRGWIGYWVWRGRADSGAMVGRGIFTIRLTATNKQGVRLVQRRRLAVKHGRYDGWYWEERRGVTTSSRQTRGNCYQAGYAGSLDIDCWGGRYSQADYVFRIPRDAHNFRWRVYGHVGCCNRGAVQRTGTRVSPTRFRIRVRVTRWRSFTVDGVYFRFDARLLFKPSDRRN